MTRFEKWSVWVTAAATFITGAGFFWAKYMVSSPEPWSVINHPLQPWFLKAHIIVSPLLIFAIGLIAARHIWRHFVNGVPWGRRTGITTALLATPMILTGYLIQAVTHEGWLLSLAISHIIFGVIFTVGLAAHQVKVRDRFRRDTSPAPPAQPPPSSPPSESRTSSGVGAPNP